MEMDNIDFHFPQMCTQSQSRFFRVLSARIAKIKKSKVIHQMRVWSFFFLTDLIDWLPSIIVCVSNC